MKRIKLNTDLLPILNVDTYWSNTFINDYDISLEESDALIQDLAIVYIKNLITSCIPSAEVYVTGVYHPSQYNYGGDELDFEVAIDEKAFNDFKQSVVDDELFDGFLQTNFKSSDGYISTLAQNIKEFEVEDEAKQLAQMLMFKIPADNIVASQEQYDNELYATVTSKYNRNDIEEDDLQEAVEYTNPDDSLYGTEYIQLYQMNPGEENHGYIFAGLDFQDDKSLARSNYSNPANWNMDVAYDEGIYGVLDDIFAYGNSDDFHDRFVARSISISDIIKYKGNYYFVNPSGFEIITDRLGEDWLKQKPTIEEDCTQASSVDGGRVSIFGEKEKKLNEDENNDYINLEFWETEIDRDEGMGNIYKTYPSEDVKQAIADAKHLISLMSYASVEVWADGENAFGTIYWTDGVEEENHLDEYLKSKGEKLNEDAYDDMAKQYAEDEEANAKDYKARVKGNITDIMRTAFKAIKDVLDNGSYKDIEVNGFYFPEEAVLMVKSALKDGQYHLNASMDLNISDILNMIEDNDSIEDAIDELFTDYDANSAFSWADNFITILSKIDTTIPNNEKAYIEDAVKDIIGEMSDVDDISEADINNIVDTIIENHLDVDTNSPEFNELVTDLVRNTLDYGLEEGKKVEEDDCVKTKKSNEAKEVKAESLLDDTLEDMNKFIIKNNLDPEKYKADIFEIRMKDVPPQEIAGIVTTYNGKEYGFRYLAGLDMWTVTLISTGADVSLRTYDTLCDVIDDLSNIDKAVNKKSSKVDKMTHQFSNLQKVIDAVYSAKDVESLKAVITNIEGLPDKDRANIISRIDNNLQGNYDANDFDDVQSMVVNKLQKSKLFTESKDRQIKTEVSKNIETKKLKVEEDGKYNGCNYNVKITLDGEHETFYTTWAESKEDAKNKALQMAKKDLSIESIRNHDNTYNVTVKFYMGDGYSYKDYDFIEADNEEHAKEEALRRAYLDLKVVFIYRESKEINTKGSLSQDLFGKEADSRMSQRKKDFDKHLQWVKDIMAGKTVIDDKYNEEVDLETAKKWLKDDYIYLKGFASLSPEDIDKKLARDIPEVFNITESLDSTYCKQPINFEFGRYQGIIEPNGNVTYNIGTSKNNTSHKFHYGEIDDTPFPHTNNQIVKMYLKNNVLKNESLKDYGIKPSNDFYQRIMNALAKELDISQYDVQKEADAIKFRYNGKVYFAEPASMYQIDVFDDNHNQIGWGVSMNDLKAEVFTEFTENDYIYELVGGEYAGTYTRAEAEKLPIKEPELSPDDSEIRNNGGFTHRKELDNQLQFKGYLGPMWNGTANGKPVIRYETQEVYDQLSEAKFKDKVKAIKKSLKDKDGRLSDETAEEQAKKIAGSMIKNERVFLNTNKASLKEATDSNTGMTFGNFKAKVKEIYNSVFPSSMCTINLGALGQDTFFITWYLAGNEEEFPNKISQNDLFHISFFIRDAQSSSWETSGNKLTDDSILPSNLVMEVPNGAAVFTKPDNDYLAYGSVKLPFRKTVGSPEKILSTLGNYANKLHDKTVELLDNNLIPDDRVELVRSKI